MIVLFAVCGVWLGMQMSMWLDRALVGRIPMLRLMIDLLAACVYYLLCRIVAGFFQTARVCPAVAETNAGGGDEGGASPHGKRGSRRS